MTKLSETQLIDQDPLQFFQQLLSAVQVKKALDVACGPGGFTGILKESLPPGTAMIGIDTSQAALDQARQNHPEDSVSFELQDAAAMDFPADTFELVSCAFSLHHLPQPRQTLAEIRRVLKPGGMMLIVEMYRDHLTATQQTESLIHHWAAEIDTSLGISHNQTFSRQEILDLVRPENWAKAKVFDLADLSFDPKGEEITTQVLETIDRVLKKAESLPDYPAHHQRAEELRQRLRTVGIHISTRLVILAEK